MTDVLEAPPSAKAERTNLLASDEQVKRATDWVEEQVSLAITGKKHNSTRYIIIGKSKAHDTERPSAICHADINYAKAKETYCVGTEIGIKRRMKMYPCIKDRALFKPFLGFILNDPIWKPYIRHVGKNSVVIDTACPQTWFQAFLICTRMFWEAAEDAFEMFNEAVERGIPPRIALLYAFHVSPACRAYTTPGDQNSRSNSTDDMAVVSVTGHRPFQLVNYKDMRRWLEVKEATGTSYHEAPSTKGVTDLLGKGPIPYDTVYPILAGFFGDLYYSERFKAALRVSRGGGEVEAYKPPNPFLRSAPRNGVLAAGQVTGKEWKTVVLDELVKEFSTLETAKAGEFVNG